MRLGWPAPFLASLLLLLGGCGGCGGCSSNRVTPPERYELPNGLQVILRPAPAAPNVAVLVLFRIGGDHDPAGRSGLAHLLEHLYVTAAAGDAPARSVEEYLARYPLGWNAQTGDRYTVVATVVPAAQAEAELVDAAARLGALQLTEADLARERPRLAAEVGNMFGGIPGIAAANLARERIRPAPLGGRRAGLPEQVAQLTVAEVDQRWRELYKPRNALLVIAGGFDATVARASVERLFGPLPAGSPAPPPAEPGAPVAGVLGVPGPSSAALPIAAAWPAPAPGSELHPALLVAVARLAAAGQLGYGALDDPEAIFARGTAPPGTTPAQAAALLEAPLERALADAPTARELSGVPAFLGLEPLPDVVVELNPYFAAFSLGRQQQLGLDPAALSAAVRRVDAAQLARLRAEVLSPARRAVVVVGSP